MGLNSSWLPSLLGLALISLAPAICLAGVNVNEDSVWPTNPIIQTFEPTDANVTSERDARYIRDLAQTFQVPTAFQIDKIFIDVEEAVADREYTIRLFTVDDVNAADPLIDPDHMSFTGSVLLSSVHTTSAAINTGEGGNNPFLVLEFDLTGPDEIFLPASVGSAGYAFQVLRTGEGRMNPDGTDPAGDSRVFKWHYNSSGNLYADGRAYAIGGGPGSNSDFLFAITAVPEPGTFALGAMSLLGMGLFRRRRNAQVAGRSGRLIETS